MCDPVSHYCFCFAYYVLKNLNFYGNSKSGSHNRNINWIFLCAHVCID